MMAESADDLEPLFDYHRVQPSINFVHIDDDGCDISPVLPKKRIKTSKSSVKEDEEELEVLEIVNPQDNEDEDWLPPPPKISVDEKQLVENSTLKQLRLKKQELEALAKSAEDVLQSVEGSLKGDNNGSLSASLEAVSDNPSQSQCARAKVVISIQDKEEIKQFRVYKDEKFERLFKIYADKAKLDIKNLVFSFDGDKISLTATPEGLGMEDDDIIEVHAKKH